MRFEGAGRGLMAAGIVCIIIYVLAALYGFSAPALRIGSMLRYIGVVAIIIGLVLRLSRPSTTI